MADLTGGNFNKFTVLKNEDVEKYLNAKGKLSLNKITETISDGRSMDNKKPQNQYLVINVDEPYAYAVIEILKRNGD